ncbi:MAG: TonB family protein [Proteobacteria bacterium]|nr:TonB family protein [Pseudomonadota bacterium]
MIIILLCVGGGWAIAQNNDDQTDQSEEQTRRPSWSSGLPEREKPEAMSRPGLSQDFQQELTIDRSELGLERPKVALPDREAEEQSASQDEPSVTTESIEESVSDSNESPESEPSVVAEPEAIIEAEPEPEPEPVIEPATYEWQVINQADIEFPSRGVRNQINGWVDVEVTLNPQGDVVSAQTVDYSDDAGIYVEAAEESLRKWTFQPPQEQGVNELVSKVYRIDFIPPEIEQPVSNQAISTSNDESPPAEQTPVENVASLDETPADNVTSLEETQSEDITGVQNSEYQWQIINQVALDYPLEAARKRLEGWVDIMVTIDPDGKVVMLEEERYSSRGRVFVEPAKESLQQWQFEPPKSQGISSNVSRSYRIEFEL